MCKFRYLPVSKIQYYVLHFPRFTKSRVYTFKRVQRSQFIQPKIKKVNEKLFIYVNHPLKHILVLARPELDSTELVVSAPVRSSMEDDGAVASHVAR